MSPGPGTESVCDEVVTVGVCSRGKPWVWSCIWPVRPVEAIRLGGKVGADLEITGEISALVEPGETCLVLVGILFAPSGGSNTS